jgi:hypothetical protein
MVLYHPSVEEGQCGGLATEGENRQESPAYHPVYCALTLLIPGRAG